MQKARAYTLVFLFVHIANRPFSGNLPKIKPFDSGVICYCVELENYTEAAQLWH